MFKSTNGNDPSLGMTIEIFERDNAYNEYTIECSEFSKESSPITIGRGSNMMIRLLSDGLSRTQCMLKCIEDKWYMIDGDGEKSSSNGTWFYVEEPFPIHNMMIFKTGSLILKSQLSY